MGKYYSILTKKSLGGYNEYTKKCERYLYNTDRTDRQGDDETDENMRKVGCKIKYNYIDEREYTKAPGGCSALSGAEWTIPDTPKDSWLNIAELDKQYTIDTTISDNTPDSELTEEQKRR